MSRPIRSKFQVDIIVPRDPLLSTTGPPTGDANIPASVLVDRWSPAIHPAKYMPSLDYPYLSVTSHLPSLLPWHTRSPPSTRDEMQAEIFGSITVVAVPATVHNSIQNLPPASHPHRSTRHQSSPSLQISG